MTIKTLLFKLIIITSFTLINTGCIIEPEHIFDMSIQFPIEFINNTSEILTAELRPLSFSSTTTKWISLKPEDDQSGIQGSVVNIPPNEKITYHRLILQEGYSNSYTFWIKIKTNDTNVYTIAGYPKSDDSALKPGSAYTEPEHSLTDARGPDLYGLGCGNFRGIYDHQKQTGDHHLYSKLTAAGKTSDDEVNRAIACYTITINDLPLDSENVSVELTKIHNLTLVNDVSDNPYQG